MKKKINTTKISIILLALLWQQISTAQETSVISEFETGFNISKNKDIPFWQKANRYGVQQQSGNKGFVSQKNRINGITENKKYTYEIKTGIWFKIERHSKIILTELNAKITRKNVFLSFGRLQEHYGLTDSTTSSGSVSLSTNALPIPQLKIGIDEYKKLVLPFILVKGYYSHGWFGNQTYAKKYYLHQKSVSFKFGKETSRFNAIVEILHNTQWGGVPKYNLSNEGDTRYINGRFPTGWYTYKNVVLPLSNPKKDTITANISPYDYENRFGNHIGQINLGGSINMPFSKIILYKQIIFETGQTFSSFTNIDDGLYGISYVSKLTKPFTKRITLEYFQTTNQGMYRPGLLRLLGIKGKHYGRNKNNYYNHNQYLDGWSYNGNNIGSPFVIPKSELKLPENSNYSTYKYLYNSVKALYLGTENNFLDLKLLTKLSISRNHSISEIALPAKPQFSGNLSCSKFFQKNNNSISLNIGLDRGELIPSNFGIQLAWKKLW